MSNAVLDPVGVSQRYETHRSKIMNLWVTRQGQQFVTSGDLQLCDVELINASVQLVGEPGIGNFGGSSAPHRSTFNEIHAVNNAGQTSIVYGIESENRILQKTHLNHGHLNISIGGMTQSHQFRTDISQAGNDLQLLVPTDLGLSTGRDPSWPPMPLLLENVHLQQNLQVNCVFAGSGPARSRLARFTEDWADSVQVAGTTRNADGTIRYFINNDEGQASLQECQVPANCIDSIKLVFKVSQRTTL